MHAPLRTTQIIPHNHTIAFKAQQRLNKHSLSGIMTLAIIEIGRKIISPLHCNSIDFKFPSKFDFYDKHYFYQFCFVFIFVEMALFRRVMSCNDNELYTRHFFLRTLIVKITME